MLDGGRISIGAMALGLAQAALDACVPYARERKQFGRPIGSFQGVAFMVADMATEIEAARPAGLARRVAQGPGPRLLAGRGAGQAVRVGGIQRATNNAVQIHGGYGYVEEYKVERFLRDAKLTEIGEGTSQIQRLVIGRKVLGPARAVERRVRAERRRAAAAPDGASAGRHQAGHCTAPTRLPCANVQGTPRHPNELAASTSDNGKVDALRHEHAGHVRPRRLR